MPIAYHLKTFKINKSNCKGDLSTKIRDLLKQNFKKKILYREWQPKRTHGKCFKQVYPKKDENQSMVSVQKAVYSLHSK